MKRTIGNMIIGGDVVNSLIQSGYDQELSAVASSPATSIQGQAVPAGGVFNGEAPPTIVNRIANTLLNQPTLSPLAHGGGGIHGRIAGNVINSIVSVSVDPDPSGINNPGQFEMKAGHDLPVRGARQHHPAARYHQREGRGHGRQQRAPDAARAPFVDPNVPADARRSSPSHVNTERRAGRAAQRPPGPLSVAGHLSHRPAIPEGAVQAMTTRSATHRRRALGLDGSAVSGRPGASWAMSRR